MTDRYGLTLAIALLVALYGCGETAQSEGKKLANKVVDAGPTDAGTPTPDTSPTDLGGAIDSASPDGGGDDGGGLDAGVEDVVVLPKPVTVPTDLPPGVTAVSLSTKPFYVAATTGKSENLSYDLTSKTISVHAVIQGDHPGLFMLAKAVNMLGHTWMKGKCGKLCTDCDNRVQASPATGTALMPSSSKTLGKLTSGTWHFGSCGFLYKKQDNSYSTDAYADKSVQTVLFVRATADGQVPKAGKLRLRLFFSGAEGITAASSHENALIKAMIQQAGQIMKTAHITLEIADRRDTGPGLADIALANDLTETGDSGLDNLFASAASAGGSAVIDVFVVRKLVKSDVGDGTLESVSGGVPGPAFYHGIPGAGVAIALSVFKDDGALAGRALARELGHFLGLWHTTERDGSVHDPIDDTPECPKSADGDSNGELSATECKGKGANNAMFWATPTAAASFTAQQGEIIRAHPLVRAQ